MAFARVFAGAFVLLLWALVLARILLTFADPGHRWRASRLVIDITEPLLAPLRRRLPSTGAFDASAVLALVFLGFLWKLLF